MEFSETAPLKGESWDVVKPRSRAPSPSIPRSVLLPVVLLFTLWILFQEATFWLLAWKASLRFALGVQSFWVFLSVLLPCACVIGKGVIHFPFRQEARMLWVVLIASGVVIGPMTAFIGGQAFASYSNFNLQEIRVVKDVDVTADAFSLLNDLGTADYLQFKEGFSVLKGSASRHYSEDQERYYCSAPIIALVHIIAGSEIRSVSFVAVSDDDCCRYLDFNCDGWTTGGNSALVLGRETVTTTGLLFDYDTATTAAQMSVNSMDHASLSSGAVMVKISSEDPGSAGRRYLIVGSVATVLGLLLWPMPALVVYLLGWKGTC